MSTLSVIVSVLFFVTACSSHSMQIGTSLNGQLAFVEEVKLSAIPLTTRTKNVFYNGEKVIRGISALDRANSKGKVTVTAGGVGSTFANVKLKSERGDGLDYQIQVFV
ncbi:uncharacterized protein [Epargyreus clarus]|uniref:uncharacterized protein n=1 Tax=Epargyreus clarus TaxID=520877 RepID=UPI003C30A3A1